MAEVSARAKKLGISRTAVDSILREWELEGKCVHIYGRKGTGRAEVWWARVIESDRVDWAIMGRTSRGLETTYSSNGRDNADLWVIIRLPAGLPVRFERQQDGPDGPFVRAWLKHADHLSFERPMTMGILLRNGFTEAEAKVLVPVFEGNAPMTRHQRRIFARKKTSWQP